MKSLLFTAILSLRKRSERLLIKFAILLQVRLTHAQTFFRGVVMDGFCRYAHARVITDFKNMADYMKSEPLISGANTEGFRKGENEDKNDCHKTTRDS